jgi:hypothetical protein
MDKDVLEEIRATRDAFAEAHGFDIRAMFATLQRMSDADPRPSVKLPPRPVTDAEHDSAAPTITKHVPAK